MSTYDEQLVRDHAERCARGDHSPEQVEVLAYIPGPPIYVWRCEWCAVELYGVPA